MNQDDFLELLLNIFEVCSYFEATWANRLPSFAFQIPFNFEFSDILALHITQGYFSKKLDNVLSNRVLICF